MSEKKIEELSKALHEAGKEAVGIMDENLDELIQAFCRSAFIISILYDIFRVILLIG